LSFVVDASVALAWHFPEEQTEFTLGCLQAVVERGALVPVHWRAEVANGMVIGARRGRITRPYRDQALKKMEVLPIDIDEESQAQFWNGTRHIGDMYGLTIYDAAYLELAQRARLPLATLDKALRRAAEQAGVKPFSTRA